MASATFRDKNQREWNITLNVGMLEDIKDTAEIDLDSLMKKPESMGEFVFGEPRKLMQVLYICCEDQIKSVPLTPKEFAKLFDRDTLDLAVDAFLKALVLFYPRTSAGKVMADNLPAILAKMDREIQAKAESTIRTALSGTVTNSPES